MKTFNPEQIRYVNDLKKGQDFIKKFKKGVTIYGSARLKEKDKDYIKAVKFGKYLGKNKINTFTGGGPGIMEAVMKGARKSGGKTIGLNIKLPNEQKLNEYAEHGHIFSYFFSRKKCLFDSAKALVFFKGGFGTFDELMEIITGVTTGKLKQKPIFLVGKEFYKPIFNLIYKKFEKDKLADKKYFKNIIITDDLSLIIKEVLK